jgi:hypothetical protein
VVSSIKPEKSDYSQLDTFYSADVVLPGLIEDRGEL